MFGRIQPKQKTQGSVKKDLNVITCFKYNQKRHYTRRCTKEDTPRLQKARIAEECRKYKKKTPQGVANLEVIVFSYYLQ
jgi:hypothetical protein